MSESVRDVVRRPAPEAITIAGLAADHFRPAGEPDGPPLVIVHGAMDRAAGFRRTARHLPYRDIVAYDRRGYAGSRDVPPVREFATQVDDLVAVLTELIAANGERRLVVGHSAGGLIALHALARPGIEELVVRVRSPWIEFTSDEVLHVNLDGEPMHTTLFRAACQRSALAVHLGSTALLGPGSNGASSLPADHRP